MTNEERKVIELALEALVAFNGQHLHIGGWIDFDNEITAIKELLAQPEQEPVATLDDLEQEIYENTRQFVSRDVMEWMLKRYYTTPPQPERYITDAMKVRQAVAQALLDDVYAEELEQPEAKQSGTISITTPTPVAYLCENAVGHKYFRWKKPSSAYKPVALYTIPPPCPTCEALARTVMMDQTGRDA